MSTDVNKLKNDLAAIRRTVGILIAETEGIERAALLAEVKRLVDVSSASIFHAQKRDGSI
ncbi:MAG TPA: hypothetical protein VKB47_08920 [Terracidiphilus sp.]|nr:hypothetical protein [Terracidiphilus sp.]